MDKIVDLSDKAPGLFVEALCLFAEAVGLHEKVVDVSDNSAGLSEMAAYLHDETVVLPVCLSHAHLVLSDAATGLCD